MNVNQFTENNSEKTDDIKKFNQNVLFDKKSSQLQHLIRNKIGAVLMSVGLGLTSSSFIYSISNQEMNEPGDGIIPAETLFTHLKGLDKYETYNKVDYDVGDGTTWEYSGTEVINNRQEENSVLDNILGYPGNGMIFIGGILLVGLGLNMSASKKEAFISQAKKALINGEKMTITADSDSNLKTNITISLLRKGDSQTQIIANGVVDGKVINETVIEKDSIEVSADKFISKILSKIN